MKAQHETEITLDRVSTREELCQVIDLISGADNTAVPKWADGNRGAARDTVAIDMPYELGEDEDAPREDTEEMDELSAKLAGLFGDESKDPGWIN